jgi:hypothetical protein
MIRWSQLSVADINEPISKSDSDPWTLLTDCDCQFKFKFHAGAMGAEWLKAFKGYIENPTSMLL